MNFFVQFSLQSIMLNCSQLFFPIRIQLGAWGWWCLWFLFQKCEGSQGGSVLREHVQKMGKRSKKGQFYANVINEWYLKQFQPCLELFLLELVCRSPSCCCRRTGLNYLRFVFFVGIFLSVTEGLLRDNYIGYINWTYLDKHMPCSQVHNFLSCSRTSSRERETGKKTFVLFNFNLNTLKAGCGEKVFL